MAVSATPSLSARATTPAAWPFKATHSTCSGWCAGVATSSAVAAASIDSASAIATGISCLCPSKSTSAKNSPAHSIHLASLVVHEALSSIAAEDSMSSRRSRSAAASATPRLASMTAASESISCSSISSAGQSGSAIAAIPSVLASGNLLLRALASGLILPDCRSDSRSAKARTDLFGNQPNSSKTSPSESTTLASLQS